jgi:hypothetical protein
MVMMMMMIIIMMINILRVNLKKFTLKVEMISQNWDNSRGAFLKNTLRDTSP